jgi:predicted dehydrogenase
MKKKYNWAILGCGKIAKKFALELKLLPNANLYAAASRNQENVQTFAHEFGVQKAYTSYQEMAEDPLVDIVYIATPHSHHLQHTLLCLNNKKAVLCEKAFAINTNEVLQMVAASKTNNTFLMEAFWELFRPKFNKVLALIKQENLGKLKMVKSDFSFMGDYNPNSRLYNLNLGGGSLLDIGIYPVFTSLMLLGEPTQINTIPQFSPTGSEESITIFLTYNNGATAILNSSFKSEYKNDVELIFENGYIKYDRFSSDPILLQTTTKNQQISFNPGPNLGYQFEAIHVMDCLDQHRIESPILPLSTSIKLMRILDAIRNDAGIVFPNHD